MTVGQRGRSGNVGLMLAGWRSGTFEFFKKNRAVKSVEPAVRCVKINRFFVLFMEQGIEMSPTLLVFRFWEERDLSKPP